MKSAVITLLVSASLLTIAPLSSAEGADEWLEEQFLVACQTYVQRNNSLDPDIIGAYDCGCMAPMLANNEFESRLSISKQIVSEQVRFLTMRPWKNVTLLPEGLENMTLSQDEIDHYTQITNDNLDQILRNEERAANETEEFATALNIINATVPLETIYEEGDEASGWIIDNITRGGLGDVHKAARSLANGYDARNQKAKAVAEACIMPNYSKTLTPLEEAESKSYSTELEEFVALSIGHCKSIAENGGISLQQYYSCDGIVDFVFEDGLVLPAKEEAEPDPVMDDLRADLEKQFGRGTRDPNPVRDFEKPLAELDPKKTLEYLVFHNDQAERALRSRKKVKKVAQDECRPSPYQEFTEAQKVVYCDCVSDFVAEDFVGAETSMAYGITASWKTSVRGRAALACN